MTENYNLTKFHESVELKRDLFDKLNIVRYPNLQNRVAFTVDFHSSQLPENIKKLFWIACEQSSLSNNSLKCS